MPRPRKKEKIQPVSPVSVPRANSPKLLKGFKDILPNDFKYWDYLQDLVRSAAQSYGFFRIETPILEDTALFVRSVGKQTDVSKDMFNFIDAGNNNVSLRPEATAAIARAYIEHGMINKQQPVKLFYWGQMFRRERPQAGRQRQFWQYGFETIGSNKAIVDAQLVLVAYNLLKSFGLKDIEIQINSIGCEQCREEYKKELISYYKLKRKSLCEECKKRLVKNPLRILDCKEEGCRSLTDQAPQILDWIDEECKNHFMQVLEYLDGLEVPYVLNPYLVRGLDYYSRTVFEIFPDNSAGAQSALAAGGRYDKLIENLGGNPAPACGFAAGIERIISLLKEQEVKVAGKASPDVYIAQIGEQAKIKAVRLHEIFRQSGILAAETFSKDSLKSQLEYANKLAVKYVLILGQKEVLDGTILFRDMESGVQEVIDFGKAESEIQKKLAKYQEKLDNENGNGDNNENPPVSPDSSAIDEDIPENAPNKLI